MPVERPLRRGGSEMRRVIQNCRFIGLLVMGLIGSATPGAQAQGTPSGPAGSNDPAGAAVQAKPDAKPWLEIYGFAMLDIGHDFKQIDPNWFDTMRVTRLPSVANEFGKDHSTFASVRQSRLGVRSSTPTPL